MCAVCIVAVMLAGWGSRANGENDARARGLGAAAGAGAEGLELMRILSSGLVPCGGE
jgi:hypothetical protein